MKRQTLLVLTCVLVSGWCSAVLAATAVEGYFGAEGLTGKTAPLHGWEDRWLWIGQVNASAGGGGRAMAVTPKGWYRLPQFRPPNYFDPGTYALFALSYDGPHGFGHRSLTIPAGVDVLQGQILTTPAHYSAMYNEAWTEWAAEPWVWGTNFYQTFVATQEHVTRICTKLAGKGGDHQELTLNFALYQTNGGAPSTWTQILPTRSFWMPGTMDPIIHIAWVPYRSNEVTLIPGQTYAARFWRNPGSPSPNFAIVARPDVGGNGYTGGMMYSGDTALPGWDAYAHISGGAPGTLVNFAPVASIQAGNYGTWATTHGQTFQASGRSLAAVDAHYITGDPAPPIKTVTFQLYDSVGGSPIGPPRTVYGWPEHYRAMMAAYWQEDEVPLVPGNMYYLEWTISGGGANVYFMNAADNPTGNAYINRTSQAPFDMLMSIAEYLPSSPIIELDPSELNARIQHGKTGTDTFTIKNVGGDTLNYQITDNRDWLGTDPVSGSCTTETDPITVLYNTSSLAVGTYTGTITVTGNAFNSPQTVGVAVEIYIPGDFDKDVDVDMEDFGYFQACLTGPGIDITDPNCLDADLDEDDDVDRDDFAILDACLSGADVAPAPACAP